MDDTGIHARLTAIETRLADISEALSRAPSEDALTERMDGVLKAQLLLGALVEERQEAIRREIAEILPGAVAAQLESHLEAEMAALSGRLAVAIGEALGDRDSARLYEQAAERRLMDALDLMEGRKPDGSQPPS